MDETLTMRPPPWLRMCGSDELYEPGQSEQVHVELTAGLCHRNVFQRAQWHRNRRC